MKIMGCATSGCGFHCCDLSHSFIVTYPNELEDAQKAGLSIDHLPIIAKDGLGGYRVSCAAKNGVNCDGGYKPLECRVFPFWPEKVEGNEVTDLLWGKKCPLHAERQPEHAAWVKQTIEELCARKPELKDWFNKVQTTGYVKRSRLAVLAA